MLSPAECYRAMQSRDVRFDGRFYTGVSSTGIYCRPICKVKMPKAQNCTFYPTAAAAESAGFRPCLKCRPELAPGHSLFEYSTQLAQAAARMIENDVAGITEKVRSLPEIADRVGVTDRHLRRIFQEEFGATPVQYAQTCKLLTAKRLLSETQLPITQVAYASGFSSSRRMHALFNERYRLSPARMRVKKASSDVIELHLSYRPPYAWKEMLEFFVKRAIPGVEQVADNSYTRSLRLLHPAHKKIISGWIAVSNDTDNHQLRVCISSELAECSAAVLAHVKRVFDLGADAEGIRKHLGKLASKHPALRLPGAFDGFELAMRTVLGQQITVKAARTLATRFVQRFAEPVQWQQTSNGVRYMFPTAARIAECALSDIAELGIVSNRAKAMIAIAQKISQGDLMLNPDTDVQRTIDALCDIAGIGPWTAHYIAMRALSWPDAWPPRDVAILNALDLPNTNAGQKRADDYAEAWKPWRSYAVLHAWHSLG